MTSRENALKRLILALDVPGLTEAETLLDQVAGRVGMVKVGLELFTACGPAAVAAVRSRHIQVFLDLKLHDIPATVEGAVNSARKLDVSMLTIHTAGGIAMMKKAAAAAGDALDILGVSLLTSMGPEDLQPVCLTGTPEHIVRKRASLAAECGLDAIVCSPEEVASIRQEVGTALKIVCPGIRPDGATRGDQKRVATPHSAISDGADYLVVGRPIRDAADPGAAADTIVAQIQTALA